MIEKTALAIVLLAALFLFVLAAISFFAPTIAVRFVRGFASSARTHYSEMVLRLIVGCAFVIYAPNMLFASAFLLFGLALVVSTTILILLPWRWHNRFGQKVVPPITNHVWLFGIFSLPLAGVIVFAALRGGA